MNAVFAIIFLLSGALLLVTDPELFLSALLKGGEKAAALSLSLLAIYSVWLGFFKVLEKSGLSAKLSRAFRPAAGKLFRSQNGEALTLACCNLSANILGLPGAPTLPGVRAAQTFCAAKEDFAADMLFVLNATSLQILPATVIALRQSYGSASAADIFLPTLLATLFSTLLGAGLLFLTRRRR